MENIYGIPQPLTGDELVTIQQEQNGNLALCTMPLSQLGALFLAANWASQLSTSVPTTPGVLWNNSGVISLS